MGAVPRIDGGHPYSPALEHQSGEAVLGRTNVEHGFPSQVIRGLQQPQPALETQLHVRGLLVEPVPDSTGEWTCSRSSAARAAR